jgi:predicted dehydrogenase
MEVAVHKTSTNESEPVDEIDTRSLSVGVIGCGYWGPKLARNFREIEASTLKIVSDLRQDRLEEIETLYPEVETTQNYKMMLDNNIDAVVIATPVSTHYSLAKEALLAGKHVLVEKPIASNTIQAHELVKLADEKHLTLMVGHTFEYNPAVEAVRQIVQTGQLGRIFYANSTRANLGLLQPDINVMWDLAPHDVSMLRFILGVDPVKVSARGAYYINTTRQLHEIVYMNLVFEGGIIANLRLSWLDPVKQRSLTLVGSQKMLVYDDIAQDKVVIYDKGVEVPPYSVTEDEFRASYRHGEVTIYPLNWTEPLRAECNHFLACIQDGSKPRSSGEDGLMVLKVLETAQRSLDNGGVELKIEY